MRSLATRHAELGHHEQAIAQLKTVLKLLPAPDAWVLNQIADLYEELGDTEREIKFYQEAARHTRRGFACFNLALVFRRLQRWDEAIVAADEAIARDGKSGAYLAMRALLAEAVQDTAGKELHYRQAFEAFGPLNVLDDFALGWYAFACERNGRSKELGLAQEERRKRQHASNSPGNVRDGELPGMVEQGSFS
jgi:tetratricopeptide (TPR) repeat protein